MSIDEQIKKVEVALLKVLERKTAIEAKEGELRNKLQNLWNHKVRQTDIGRYPFK